MIGSRGVRFTRCWERTDHHRRADLLCHVSLPLYIAVFSAAGSEKVQFSVSTSLDIMFFSRGVEGPVLRPRVTMGGCVFGLED